MPGSPVVKPPCVAERPGAKRGGINRAVCNASEARTSVVTESRREAGERGSRAGSSTAKATEGALGPGAGAEEPSGVLGVERADGRSGNWGEPSRPRRLRGGGKRCPAYNRRTREVVWAVERQSERVVVVLIGGTTQPARSEGPAPSRCTGRGRRT